MKLQFSKKSIISLVLIVLFAGGGILGSYYLFINPLVEKKQAIARNLEFEKKQLDLLSKQLQASKLDQYTETTQIQRRLPVEPLFDQFILDLHRAEGLSNSYIVSIDIDPTSDYSSAVETDKKNDGAVNQSDAIEDIKQIKVHLSVRTRTYEDVASFLTEIDQLPRLVNIDSVSFVGRDEMIMIDGGQDSLEFRITISTYYYPVLKDLRDEVPKFEYNQPSGKKNPLYET